MNQDRVEGCLMQLSGIAKERWGRFTGSQRHVDAGKRDQRFGRLQEQYGNAMETAERELKAFLARNRHWQMTRR